MTKNLVLMILDAHPNVVFVDSRSKVVVSEFELVVLNSDRKMVTFRQTMSTGETLRWHILG